MYFLSIIAIIITFIFTSLLSSGWQEINLAVFIDTPSFVILFILCIPIMISSNALKDFFNGIRLMSAKQKPQSVVEIKRAILAVRLMMRTLSFGCLFVVSLTIVLMLYYLDDLNRLGPNLAIMMLAIIYVAGMILLLLPVHTKLEFLLIEFMHREEPEDEEPEDEESKDEESEDEESEDDKSEDKEPDDEESGDD